MNSTRSILLALCISIGGFAALVHADEITITPDLAQLAVKLMETTKTSLIMDYDEPAETFKPDGDPETLETVMLKSKKLGSSHVSEDGEVIFIAPRTKDKVQTDLFVQAFHIRALRKLQAEGGTPQK
jgi:hypothetical protein